MIDGDTGNRTFTTFVKSQDEVIVCDRNVYCVQPEMEHLECAYLISFSSSDSDMWTRVSEPTPGPMSVGLTTGTLYLRVSFLGWGQ